MKTTITDDLKGRIGVEGQKETRRQGGGLDRSVADADRFAPPDHTCSEVLCALGRREKQRRSKQKNSNDNDNA